MRFFIISICLLSVFIPQFAFAHAVGGNGFMAGLTHPVGGLDHLLAMIAVGLVSTQMLSNKVIKPIYGVPITFVTIMLLGGFVGFWGIDVPMKLVEISIVLSVLILGLGVALGKSFLNTAGKCNFIYLAVAFFGFFHGYAHGVEMPAGSGPANYAAGFVISTILIHIAGVIVGWLFSKSGDKGDQFLRFVGVVITFIGIWMFVSRFIV